MKLAIISDIHDNRPNLEKCLGWCRRELIEALLCCGDVTNLETLEFLANGFSGPIYLVRGNIDYWEDKEAARFKNINNLGRDGGLTTLGEKKIGLCHEPGLLDDLIDSVSPDIAFFGHTHRPWEEVRSGVRVVNPGTLGGVFQKATFAVYDTESGELELKILEQIPDGQRTQKN